MLTLLEIAIGTFVSSIRTIGFGVADSGEVHAAVSHSWTGPLSCWASKVEEIQFFGVKIDFETLCFYLNGGFLQAWM